MIVPAYLKSSESAADFLMLRERVKKVIEMQSKSKQRIITIKAIVFPLMFVLLYLAALNQALYPYFLLFYVLMGAAIVLIFINLIHEAAHGNISKNKTINNFYVLLLDLLGANSYMWKNRHIKLHHNFTNVIGWDSDIEKSKFVKVHEAEKEKRKTRFPGWVFFFYPFFVISWFLIRDFRDFFSRKQRIQQVIEIDRKEYFKMFFFKIFFLSYTILIPYLITPFSLGQVVLAFFLLLISTGIVGLVVLLPPHANTLNTFTIIGEDMQIKNSWLMHQLISTNDVNENNWFTKYVFGNFNFHLAHHLFPNVSHIYAKEVTAEIKKFCEEKKLPYRSYPFLQTLRSHYKLVVSKESDFNILEEDM